MQKTELITLRVMVESDKNFVMSTIMKGLYYGESWFSEIPKQTFMIEYHKVIEFLLNKPTTHVVVACLREDPDVILGYSICTAPDIAHWVFIKKSWRGIGIANSLVPKDVRYATHLTKTGLSIIRKKNIDFNPFMI
jgi:hypothetical protein